ncbi:MAG TPA: hypothetical protein HA263_03780 [Methanoregulaceae archaeon]|nr:hypothetical protein [Methanoregulaceae archaeon]
MDLKRVVGAIVGLVLAVLGLLWFLQGTGVVRMCPVLCFADCECVEGGSRFWEIAGAITSGIGAILAGVSLRRGNG